MAKPSDDSFIKSNALANELIKLADSPVEQLVILIITLGGVIGAMTRGSSNRNFEQALDDACAQVRTFAGIAKKIHEEIDAARQPDEPTRH